MVNTSPIDFFEGNKPGTAQSKKFPLYQYSMRYNEDL
jgi:hypothetical protein